MRGGSCSAGGSLLAQGAVAMSGDNHEPVPL
jgi:hypothetical protein